MSCQHTLFLVSSSLLLKKAIADGKDEQDNVRPTQDRDEIICNPAGDGLVTPDHPSLRDHDGYNGERNDVLEPYRKPF